MNQKTNLTKEEPLIRRPLRPLISVITVSFNSEKTIERTIQSVLNQNFKDFEYWIIDGRSTDGTSQILQKYANEKQIKITSESDRGIYDAMNKGVQRASGQFLHFLNADDVLISPDSYELVSKYLKNQNTVYHAQLEFHHNDGHVRILGHEIRANDLCFGLRGIHQPATFFPKEMFERHGLFKLEYKISADYELIRRFCSREKTFFIDKVILAMADGGVSSKQIKLASQENREIAYLFGENWILILIRDCITKVGVFLRNKVPFVFHPLSRLKNWLF
jgi:glycosyltransferase involved in cell wall biosynthesis